MSGTNSGNRKRKVLLWGAGLGAATVVVMGAYVAAVYAAFRDVLDDEDEY